MADPEAASPHAVVVGASSGIGLSVARRLAERMPVTALARRVERFGAADNAGINGLFCDVGDSTSIDAALTQAVAERGKISALVYCAGAQVIKPMRMMKPADIDRVIDVNVKGALHVARHMASARMAQGDAVFCGVSSIAAKRPEPGIVAYAAAKAALDAMIKGLARELAPRRFVGVAPGWLDTEMTQSQAHIYNAQFREELARRTPLGIASIQGVTDLILYLLSPAAASITGQIVTIDGGASL